jgi:hypothetical protein
MKRLILTLLVATTSLAAFAQGKIRMENDANHLLYYSIGYGYFSPTFAGQLVSNTGPGANILVDLYGGSTAGSMVLQTTVPMSSTPGRFGPATFTSPNLPGGVTAFMQIRIRGPSFFDPWGQSGIFTFTPSSTIAHNSIVNAGGTALSTWTAGSYADLNSDVIRIAILPVPEPSALALTGLGLSALLLRRGSKSED